MKEKQFILQTDASERAIGAVLQQEQDGMKFPICYISRKLQQREMHYATIEKECLTVAWAIQKLHLYLYGQDFILQVDHQPLLHLNKNKVSNARLIRWAMQFQPYRFTTESIKGKDNIHADFMSRVEMK